jgi:hypothetical protein
MLTRAQQGDIYVDGLERIDTLFRQVAIQHRYDQITITRVILTEVATEFLAANPQVSSKYFITLLDSLFAHFLTDVFYSGLFLHDCQDITVRHDDGDAFLHVRNINYYLKSHFRETIQERDTRLGHLKVTFLESTPVEALIEKYATLDKNEVLRALDQLLDSIFADHYFLTNDEFFLVRGHIINFLKSNVWPVAQTLHLKNGQCTLIIPQPKLFQKGVL